MKNHNVALLALLYLSACSPKVDNLGYVEQEPIKDRVVVGQTSKQEILDQFGSPSSQSNFGEETWYYIHNVKETMTFFAPEIKDESATAIAFDSKGIVSKLDTYNDGNVENVHIASRETPTEGHQMNFFEQVLSNVGRFNKPGSTGTLAGGRQPSTTGGI